jgi:hypothetical protein
VQLTISNIEKLLLLQQQPNSRNPTKPKTQPPRELVYTEQSNSNQKEKQTDYYRGNIKQRRKKIA